MVTINRDQFAMIETACQQWAYENGVRIYADNAGAIIPKTWSVNWGGMGDKSPVERIAYAETIVKAAKIAEWLNDREYAVDPTLDDGYEYEKDTFDFTVRTLKAYFNVITDTDTEVKK